MKKFFESRKKMGQAALLLLALLIVTIFVGLHWEDSINPMVFVVVFVSCFLAMISAFTRWDHLKATEKAKEFEVVFGVDMSQFNNYCDESCNAEERQSLQLLVNRVLQELAEIFHVLREQQQNQFKRGSRKVPNDSELCKQLAKSVTDARRAFWKASDLAKHFRFKVKESYTEWLSLTKAEGVE